jgi:FkbM family methyltransferase
MEIPIQVSSDGRSSKAPKGPFGKPSVQITGRRASAVLLQGLIWPTATLSSLTNHRGFGLMLGALSKIPFFRDTYCKTSLASDSVFVFDATDPYWGFYMYNGLTYERSIHHLFAAVSDIDYQVLDCGANYGYWSVLLSGMAYGKRNVIAIEASAKTFANLTANCALNGNRFTCMNRVVSGGTGVSFVLETPTHESAHVCAHVSISNQKDCETVQSISLDDLCGMLKPTPDRLVIKLDIEGHEIEAMTTAECIKDSDVLVIYEDHGFDLSSRNSAYVLELGNLALFWIDENGCYFCIENLSEINAIKKPHNYGYNFFAATRGGHFYRCLRERLGRTHDLNSQNPFNCS